MFKKNFSRNWLEYRNSRTYFLKESPENCLRSMNLDRRSSRLAWKTYKMLKFPAYKQYNRRLKLKQHRNSQKDQKKRRGELNSPSKVACWMELQKMKSLIILSLLTISALLDSLRTSLTMMKEHNKETVFTFSLLLWTI